MTILFVLVPLALVIVAMAVAAFVWAAQRGQFDDLTTPAWRILRDDAARPAERAGEAALSQPKAPAPPPAPDSK